MLKPVDIRGHVVTLFCSASCSTVLPSGLLRCCSISAFSSVCWIFSSVCWVGRSAPSPTVTPFRRLRICCSCCDAGTWRSARAQAGFAAKPAGCYRLRDRTAPFADRPAAAPRATQAGATTAWQAFSGFIVVVDVAERIQRLRSLTHVFRRLSDLLPQLGRFGFDALYLVQRFRGFRQVLLNKFFRRRTDLSAYSGCRVAPEHQHAWECHCRCLHGESGAAAK